MSIALWKCMVRIRVVEEQIATRYPSGQMRCPTHLSIGQEAPAAGICLALKHQDQVVSTHRAHAHYLAKGGNLYAMLCEIYGKLDGCSRGKGGSMHLMDWSAGFAGSTAIVGNSFPVAAGLALHNQLAGNEHVVTAFFGDGAVEEGSFHETLNFASQRGLRLLSVCENNAFSVYSPISVRQPERPIYKLAEAHGIKSYKLSGLDAVEIFQTAGEVIHEIRNNSRPVFLEIDSFRWREHCGPNYDDHLGYRSSEWVNSWRARDPIDRLYNQLVEQGISEIQLGELKQEITKEVLIAFEKAETAEFPHPSQAFENVYETGNP